MSLHNRLEITSWALLLLLSVAGGGWLLAVRASAVDVLDTREAMIGINLRLFRDTPSPAPAELPNYVGRTIRLDGELTTHAPLRSPFFGHPAVCYRVEVRSRRVEMRHESQYAYSGKYSSNQRQVSRPVEHWDRLQEQHALRPVLLRVRGNDALIELPVELPEEALMAAMPMQFQREVRGEQAFEESWCPLGKHLTVVGQLIRRSGDPASLVLTRVADEAFRIVSYDPERVSTFEAELDEARESVAMLNGGLAAWLAALIAGIFLFRRRLRVMRVSGG